MLKATTTPPAIMLSAIHKQRLRPNTINQSRLQSMLLNLLNVISHIDVIFSGGENIYSERDREFR